MRLVHFADLHLGYRQYQRLTPLGINQREADVAASFRYVVDKTIELRPDLIVIAGDVFHNVRPTNPAILHAFRQFARMTSALPDTLVIMVAGNHDTPRASETGGILRLFEPIGITVVDREPQRLSFPEKDLSVLAVPNAGAGNPSFVPDDAFRYNVLVRHGQIVGLPDNLAFDRPSAEVLPSELNADRWSYQAHGDFHVFREIASNAFYSGSIDYTSQNTWGELGEERASRLKGKCFLEYDLDEAKLTRHEIPASRALVDLPPINARGMSVAEVDAHIRAVVEGCKGGIDDKIVRLVVRDLPRHIARELDHKALRDFKRRAMHFHLDTRRPEIMRTAGLGAPGRRPSLAEVVRDKLQSRMIESDIDRAALVEMGLRYLREAENATAPPSTLVEG